MRPLRPTLSLAGFLASVVACNALLDNPERHLAGGAGAGGSGSHAGVGGSSNAMGGNRAGAGGRSAGTGGSDAAGSAGFGGAGTSGGMGGGNVGGGVNGGSHGGSVAAGEAGEAGAGDSAGTSMSPGGTGGSVAAGGMAGELPAVDDMGVPLAKPGDEKSESGEILNLGDMRLVNDRRASTTLNCPSTESNITVNDGGVGWSFWRQACGGDDTDFPEIEFGIHPFGADATSAVTVSPSYSSTKLLPLQLKDIHTASVTLENLAIALTESGSWTLGFRYWLSNFNPATSPSPAAALELVVLWGWSTNRSVCSQQSAATSAGKEYDTCATVDSYGWGGRKWRYVEFRSADGPAMGFTGAFDVKPFLDWISPDYSQDYWVTRFEIGSDVGDDTRGGVTLENVTFEVNGVSRPMRLGE